MDFWKKLSAKQQKLLAYFAAICICALPLFAHLDGPPVQVWDEMRNAENALEMNQSGNWLVTSFAGKPETWNTKPPLFTGLVALSQKAFGYNELSLRLPSALAALFTCLFLLWFVERITRSWWPGLIAVIILVSTPGYVALHGTRTGDFDSLLTLFTLFTACYFFLFIEEEKPQWLWLSSVALIAAVLTKGVAGLFITPALFAFIFLRRKGLWFFRQKQFYRSTLLSIVLIGGYYLLRNHYQHGYWQLVYENELGGRFSQAIELHKGDAYTYFNALTTELYVGWKLLLLPAFLSILVLKNERVRNMLNLCLVSVLSIFFIINSAETKLSWYLLPLYPLLAIICGNFVYQCCQLLALWDAPKTVWKYNVLPFFLVLFLAWTPYVAIIDSNFSDKFNNGSAGINDAGIYFKEVLAGHQKLKGTVLCGDAYPLFFYKNVLKSQGNNMLEKSLQELQSGMDVIAWEQPVKDSIMAHHSVEIIENFRNVSFFHIR